MVITKGSGRIAEVAARFTLDAMPGKQMAIDADMAQGLLTEEEARQARKELTEEGSFFGAMDGASKFVRGDATAGLIITGINIVGGIIIGMVQHDLTFSTAAEFYTKLTVGDGLVSNIPALVVSLGSGVLVTKAGVDNTGGSKLFEQLSGFPLGMMVTGAMIFLLGLFPGLPIFTFSLLGGSLFYAGWVIYKKEKEAGVNEALGKSSSSDSGDTTSVGSAGDASATGEDPQISENPASALKMDIMRLELGYGLLSLVNSGQEGQWLTDQIKALRRQLAQEVGFIMPSVRIQDNMQLASNTYVVKIKEIEADRGEVRANMILVMDPQGEEIYLQGEKTLEPTFKLPALWTGEENREEALFKGYTVVDPTTVLTTHLTEIVRENLSELLSYSETQKLLDEMDESHNKLVSDIIPSQITLTGVQRVLQNLLSERISIRDLPTILEAVAEAIGYSRSSVLITEHVRSRIARQICDAYSDEDGILSMISLSPQWEQNFIESLVSNNEEKQLAMPPSLVQDFITEVRTVFEKLAVEGEMPVLVVSPIIRPYVRSVIERFRAITPVLSQAEIHPKVKIRTLAQV